MAGSPWDLMSQFGTSLEDTRKLMEGLRPFKEANLADIEQQRQRRNRLAQLKTTPAVMTVQEAKLLGFTFNINTPDIGDWAIKFVPDAADPQGFKVSYKNNKTGWEYTQDNLSISPEGKTYTQQQINDLIQQEKNEQARWEKTRSIFGNVFRNDDLKAIFSYAGTDPTGFQQQIFNAGDNDNTRFILKTVYGDNITDEQINDFFNPPPAPPPEASLPTDEGTITPAVPSIPPEGLTMKALRDGKPIEVLIMPDMKVMENGQYVADYNPDTDDFMPTSAERVRQWDISQGRQPLADIPTAQELKTQRKLARSVWDIENGQLGLRDTQTGEFTPQKIEPADIEGIVTDILARQQLADGQPFFGGVPFQGVETGLPPEPRVIGGPYTTATGIQPSAPEIPIISKLKQAGVEISMIPSETLRLFWEPEGAEENYQNIWGTLPPENTPLRLILPFFNSTLGRLMNPPLGQPGADSFAEALLMAPVLAPVASLFPGGGKMAWNFFKNIAIPGAGKAARAIVEAGAREIVERTPVLPGQPQPLAFARVPGKGGKPVPPAKPAGVVPAPEVTKTFEVIVTQGTIKPKGGIEAPFERTFTVNAKTARAAVKSVKDTGIRADKVTVREVTKAIPKPAEVVKPAVKEPWQMTLDEFKDRLVQTKSDVDIGYHKTIVRKALSEGKPVSPEVLKDYPELAKGAPAKPAPAKPAVVKPPAGVKPLISKFTEADKQLFIRNEGKERGEALFKRANQLIDEGFDKSESFEIANREISEALTAVAKAAPEAKVAKPAVVEPQKPEFAANIKLEKYPEELRPIIKEWADSHPDLVQEARRGVRSDIEVLADAKKLVEEVGGDFSKLQKKWKPGEAWNAEEILALRGVLRNKTDAVLQAQKAAQSGATKDLINLQLAIDEQAGIQNMVHGVTAEAGRALRQFRQEAFDAFNANDVEKMGEILRKIGGRKNTEKLAKALGAIDLNDPGAVSNFIRQAKKPHFWDYITEIYYNSILSGPKTHIVNSLSNTVNAIGSPLERFTAAVIDKPLSMIQQRALARHFGEIPADAFGAISGIKDGVKAWAYTMRHGRTLSQASKYEMGKAFTGKLGYTINFPSTNLEAADGLMRQINYRAAFNATAYRMVKTKGLKGQEAINALAELIQNPTQKLLKEANKTAEYRLFRAEPGQFVRGIMGVREALSIGGFKPLRYLFPFIRTPTNLWKYGMERSPLGWLNPNLWKNVIAKNPEASDQIARAVLGTMAAFAIAGYVGEDKITGAAPTGKAERDRFYRDGKQPFSIRIGDKWVSYQRIEPFNQTFAQVAAYVGAIKDKEKDIPAKAQQIVATVSQNMVSQTYMNGVAAAIDVVSQPERYMSNIFNRFATALIIPASSLTRTVTQWVDNSVRQPETFWETLQADIPGLSFNVPPRVDVMGQEITRESPAISPITISPVKETELTKELDRLKINIGFAGKTIAGVELTPEQQRQYQIDSGNLIKQRISDLISSSSYPSLSDKEKERQINKQVYLARAEAQRAITGEEEPVPPSEVKLLPELKKDLREYEHTQERYGPDSPQAQLLLIDNEELFNYIKDKEKIKPIIHSREFLEKAAKFWKDDDAYNKMEPENRKDWLADHPEYARFRFERVAMGLFLPEEHIEDYIDWRLAETTWDKEILLKERPGFYEAGLGKKLFKLIDFTKVASREVKAMLDDFEITITSKAGQKIIVNKIPKEVLTILHDLNIGVMSDKGNKIISHTPSKEQVAFLKQYNKLPTWGDAREIARAKNKTGNAYLEDTEGFGMKPLTEEQIIKYKFEWTPELLAQRKDLKSARGHDVKILLIKNPGLYKALQDTGELTESQKLDDTDIRILKDLVNNPGLKAKWEKWQDMPSTGTEKEEYAWFDPELYAYLVKTKQIDPMTAGQKRIYPPLQNNPGLRAKWQVWKEMPSVGTKREEYVLANKDLYKYLVDSLQIDEFTPKQEKAIINPETPEIKALYRKYQSIPSWDTKKRKEFRKDNPAFNKWYEAEFDVKGLEEEVVDHPLYAEYKKLPLGKARTDFRRKNPDLNQWGVDNKKWAPLAKKKTTARRRTISFASRGRGIRSGY